LSWDATSHGNTPRTNGEPTVPLSWRKTVPDTVHFFHSRSGLAALPSDLRWHHVYGAAWLGGIGFTMSLFIAGQAFPVVADFAAAKVAVFSASVLAAVLGVAVLWGAASPARATPAA